MKLKVNHIQFIAPINTYKGKVIRTANAKNRDTFEWDMVIVPEGVLCTQPDGQLLLVPNANISVMRVEEVKSAPKKGK